MDFNTAWQRAKVGYDSGLFAADHVYGVHINPRTYGKSQSLQQTMAARIAAHQKNVWPEYAGQYTHTYQQQPRRVYTYHQATKQQKGVNAFTEMERFLERMRCG